MALGKDIPASQAVIADAHSKASYDIMLKTGPKVKRIAQGFACDSMKIIRKCLEAPNSFAQ